MRRKLDQEEVFKKLQQVPNWGELAKEMLAYAISRSGHYHWSTGGLYDLPGGQTHEDLVQQVIVKTLDGTRKWDPAKGSIKPWLIDQMKSEIDNLAKSALHRQTIYLTSNEEKGENTQIPSSINVRKAKSPELIVEEAKMFDELLEAIKDEQELEEYFLAIIEVGPKPRFIAEELGKPVKEIYNLRKRAARRILAFHKEQEQ